MKTNIMIRIDENVAQSAKSVDLNISKICEEALMHAVQEETQPYQITVSRQIVFSADLLYNKKQSQIAVLFSILNTSEENVILDRITYKIFIQPAKQTGFGDPTPQTFKGVILERNTIQKGQWLGVSDALTFEQSKITSMLNEELSWRIYPELFVDSKRGILNGKFEQKLDDNGQVAARPLKVIEL